MSFYIAFFRIKIIPQDDSVEVGWPFSKRLSS